VYPLLSIVWIASLFAFLVMLAVALAGLAGSIGPIMQGIGEMRSGSTTGGGFDSGLGTWTFIPWSPVGSTGTWNATDGNPGGFASMSLDGRAGELVSGYWSASFVADGSYPYLAELTLDYRVLQVSDILGNVTLGAYVDRNPGSPPDLGQEVWKAVLTAPAPWTVATSVYPDTGEILDFIDVSSRVSEPGTYYLKVAAMAWNQPGPSSAIPTIVGFDNVRLAWTTYAYVDFVVIVPYPLILYVTQDPTFFYVWVGTLVTAAVAALSVLVFRDARRLWAAVRLPLDRLPAKLRSRSAFVAITQTFLAVTFLNIVVALTMPVQEPSFFQAIPPWYYLYVLFNATVYEEIIFRVLIIGVPLLVGSLACRIANTAKGKVPAGTAKGRYVLGSFRYLYGGGMSRQSSPSTLLPALLLLLANAVVFGLAHAPGYGDWKVLPAAVAGLAMGYLYLRHGLAASILFHLTTNMFVAAANLLGATSDASLLLSLFYLALALPGAGFFAYYFVYAYRLAKDVWRRPGPARAPPPSQSMVAPPAAGYAGAPPPGPPAPPPTPAGYPPPPVAPSGYPPPRVGYPPGVDYVPASPPPVYGRAPVQFRCPRCGWVEAVYESGRFRCARCGYVS